MIKNYFYRKISINLIKICVYVLFGLSPEVGPNKYVFRLSGKSFLLLINFTVLNNCYLAKIVVSLLRNKYDILPQLVYTLSVQTYGDGNYNVTKVRIFITKQHTLNSKIGRRATTQLSAS